MIFLRSLLFCLLLMVAAVFSLPSFAEELEDSTLRSIYSEIEAVHSGSRVNKSKMLVLFDKRYADDLVYDMNVTTNILPETQHAQVNKAQLIDMTDKTLDAVSDLSTAIHIDTIDISADQASVTYGMVQNGRVTAPMQDGQMMDFTYESVGACVDVWEKRGSTLMAVRGECDVQAQYQLP